MRYLVNQFGYKFMSNVLLGGVVALILVTQTIPTEIKVTLTGMLLPPIALINIKDNS